MEIFLDSRKASTLLIYTETEIFNSLVSCMNYMLANFLFSSFQFAFFLFYFTTLCSRTVPSMYFLITQSASHLTLEPKWSEVNELWTALKVMSIIVQHIPISLLFFMAIWLFNFAWFIESLLACLFFLKGKRFNSFAEKLEVVKMRLGMTWILELDDFYAVFFYG